MSLKTYYNKLKSFIYLNPLSIRIGTILSGVLLSDIAMAQEGGIIPIASSDQMGSGNDQDFLDILQKLFRTKVGPILVYGIAIYLVVRAMLEVAQGLKMARERDDWGVMKSSVVSAAIMVTIGLGLGFVGEHILENWTPGSSK